MKKIEKNYVEVLKGRNHGQPESKKTDKDTYSRRPSKFKQQISFNHDHPRQEFNKTTPFTPRYVNFFLVIVFIVLTLDIRLSILME
jgi:predicted AAA+ superfamily ATPase